MPKEPPATETIGLLIVDDHDILRYGLRALLRGCRDVEVVGEAASFAEAVERASQLRPRVILMDEQLPDGSGVEACREILSAEPATRVLFFSAHSDGDTVLSAMLAGAHGHVSKELELEVLLDAIRAVARGATVFDEALRRQVAAAIDQRSQLLRARAAPEQLSPQEERVMVHVVEGRTNKEIAARLSLSDKTVKNYLYNAFQKLGVGRRAEAVSVFELARMKRLERGEE